jgi:hypothetical protein
VTKERAGIDRDKALAMFNAICFRVIDVKLRKVQFQRVVTNFSGLAAGAWCRMILGVTTVAVAKAKLVLFILATVQQLLSTYMRFEV